MENVEYLPEGTVIDQRYEVISTLSCADGRAVYLCRLTVGDNKKVAMKVMHRPRPGEDFAITAKRFRTELVAAYQISHPNVVHVYEFIQHPKFLAYTMEYVGGGNLEQVLDNENIIDAERVRKFLSQISAGLHTIHESGIIHRELKPRNILITEDGEAKITDFGVARIESNKKLTMHGSLVGTMDYLSPEYIAEGKLTKSLDIYSLGIIGYQMLTGVIPFSSSDMMTMLTSRLSEDPQAPCDIVADCPRELSDIILKALARDPKDRFATALDMHLALDAIGKLDQVLLLGDSAKHSVVKVVEQEVEDEVIQEPQYTSNVNALSVGVNNELFEHPEFEEFEQQFDDFDDSDDRSRLITDSVIVTDSQIINDSGVIDEPTPTISEIHRAVERHARSKIAHPIFLCLVCFLVAMGAGFLVDSGMQGKSEAAQASQAAPIKSEPAPVIVEKKIIEPEVVVQPEPEAAKTEDDGTLNEYKLLLGLNPTDPKVNYNLGLLYVGRGEYETAEKYLSEAVRLDPQNTTAQYYLKRVKQKLDAQKP